MAVEKIFIDMSEEQKVSAVKERARKVLIDAFMEFLEERCEKVRKVASNKIGVVVGQALDLDGFTADLVDVITIEAKTWYDKEEGLKRPVTRYDLDDEADAYEAEVKAKGAPKKGIG